MASSPNMLGSPDSCARRMSSTCHACMTPIFTRNSPIFSDCESQSAFAMLSHLSRWPESDGDRSPYLARLMDQTLLGPRDAVEPEQMLRVIALPRNIEEVAGLPIRAGAGILRRAQS